MDEARVCSLKVGSLADCLCPYFQGYFRGYKMYDITKLFSRLRDKIQFTDDCWLWAASTFSNGYGQFKYENKNWKAHRLVYTLLVGPIPEDLMLLHRCDVRTCVNPAHLWVGTHQDNMDDCAAKGRRAGEANPNSKLSARQVQEIRDLCNCGLFQRQEIAELYGISGVMVRYIRIGANWKDHHGTS